MSRSGYTDDYSFDHLAAGRWRGRVASATRGKRGQGFFRDLLAALDGMEEKRLIANSLAVGTGEVCALGALGKVRGIDVASLDPFDIETVAGTFGIAGPLAREVVEMNDLWKVTPEVRWQWMRAWVAKQIKTPVRDAPRAAT